MSADDLGKTFRELPPEIKMTDEGRLLAALEDFHNEYNNVEALIVTLTHFERETAADIARVRERFGEFAAQEGARVACDQHQLLVLVDAGRYTEAQEVINAHIERSFLGPMLSGLLDQIQEADVLLPAEREVIRGLGVVFDTLGSAIRYVEVGATLRPTGFTLPTLGESLPVHDIPSMGEIEHGKPTDQILITAKERLGRVKEGLDKIPDDRLDAILVAEHRGKAASRLGSDPMTAAEAREALDVALTSPYLEVIKMQVKRINSKTQGPYI